MKLSNDESHERRLPDSKMLCGDDDDPRNDSILSHYLGKEIAEVRAQYDVALHPYLYDLWWMGPEAFCFYLPALVAYVKSDASVGDGSVAELCLPLGLQLDANDSCCEYCGPEVVSLVLYIVSHWSKFEWTPGSNRLCRDLWDELVQKWGQGAE